MFELGCVCMAGLLGIWLIMVVCEKLFREEGRK